MLRCIRRSAVRVVPVALAALSLLGCSPDPDARFGANDKVDIIAAAVHERVGRFERVSIVDRYGSETADGPLSFEKGSPEIGSDVRRAIEATVAPASVTWVGSVLEVIKADPFPPTDGELRVVLTVGIPSIDGDGAVITTGLHCGGACGSGGAYTVEREGSTWEVTGTVGPQWMA